MELYFSVGGMTCSVCSQTVEKGVKKLVGVESAQVSLIEKKMRVTFDESILNASDIIVAVQKLGYTADIYNGETENKYAQANALKKRFFTSLILLIPLMYLCMGKMLSLPVFIDDRINFSLSFILALAILIINRKFFVNGIKAIKNGSPNMDTLVSLGSASAFIFSLVETILLFIGVKTPSHTFFDSSAMVVSLVTLGKWLEELSKIKTGSAVEKLGKMLPKYSTILVDGKEKNILSTEIKIGDKVIVKAGEFLSIDGIVIDGLASVDKSAITGESMPEHITTGCYLQSGSLITEGYLIIEAQKVGKETLFSQIEEIVKKASSSKAPIQRFADKVAGVFVPIVSALALITFLVWIIITSDIYKSFNFGVSVLVISCPCALGLATPVAVTSAIGKSAKYGILFKNAGALQTANKINCVLLDKTATLTVGKPKVINFINFNSLTDEEIKNITYALEVGSSHPLAECVKEYCEKTNLTATNFVNQIGKGVSGKINGTTYYLGNEKLLPFSLDGYSEKLNIPSLQGKTLLYLADNSSLLAVYGVSDYLKEDSIIAVKNLLEKGVKVVLVTGDNEQTAKLIAKEVGITKYYHSVLPQDKYEIVEKYKKKGYFVAMVGDGINDSPALKSADIGIAIGTGTDIAIDSAEVVIANGSLSGISKTIDLSKRALKIIKQNLFWAFCYNVIAIPIAGGVLSFIGITLTPWMASACMCISSLFVVLNALRISGKEKNKSKIEDDIMEIKIDGMMCKHCEARVKEGIESINGVESVEINLKKKLAFVSCEEDAKQKILDKIEELGYKVLKVK